MRGVDWVHGKDGAVSLGDDGDDGLDTLARSSDHGLLPFLPPASSLSNCSNTCSPLSIITQRRLKVHVPGE